MKNPDDYGHLIDKALLDVEERQYEAECERKRKRWSADIMQQFDATIASMKAAREMCRADKASEEQRDSQ